MAPVNKTLLAALPVATVGVAPVTSEAMKMKKKKDELIQRYETLKNEKLPQAAVTALGTAALSSIATYNLMKAKAERDIKAKYSGFTQAADLFLKKIAKGSLLKGVGYGAAAAIPIGLGSKYLFDKYTENAKKQLAEGEQKINFYENNMNTLGAAAGTILGTAATVPIAKKKFQTLESYYA